MAKKKPAPKPVELSPKEKVYQIISSQGFTRLDLDNLTAERVDQIASLDPASGEFRQKVREVMASQFDEMKASVDKADKPEGETE